MVSGKSKKIEGISQESLSTALFSLLTCAWTDYLPKKNNNLEGTNVVVPTIDSSSL